MKRREFLKSAAVLAVAATLPAFVVADGTVKTAPGFGDIRIEEFDWGERTGMALKRGDRRHGVRFDKPMSEMTDDDIIKGLRMLDEALG